MPRPIDPSARLKRLQTLADLWGKVYLFHPAIVTKDIDWNQALVRAIPRVEAAETPEELVNAVNEELLAPLGDLLTFAEAHRDRGTRDRAADAEFKAGLVADSVGYIRVPQPSSRGPGFLADFQAAVESLGEVEKLVVDLRWTAAPGHRINDPVLGFFMRAGLLTGPVMNRVHEGWSEDNGLGAYRQKWEVVAGTKLHPIQEADWFLTALYPGTDFSKLKPITRPVVFLVNRASALSYYKALDALQSQPGVAVVFEPSGPGAETLQLRLDHAPELVVQLNTERLVGLCGGAGFCPDLVVDKPVQPAQLAAIAEQALAARTRDEALGTKDQTAKLMNLMLPAPMSETGASLCREERLLGLFKVWNVVRFLYPHLELCDMDWHSCLQEWIPKIEQADSTVAYVRTLRMLTAHLHDNNIFYFFPGLPEPRALPVGFGWVEDRIIVTEVLESGIALEVGDELVEFDGKTVPELIAEHRLQFSYSTEGSFYRHMCEMLGFGTASAEVKLGLRRHGQPVSLTLRRTVTREAWVGRLARRRESPGYRVLDGDLGYLDLSRLSNMGQFDEAFDALLPTRGLIIDLRGHPGFMVQLALSARLSDRPVKSAIFEIPVVSNFARLEQGWSTGQYEIQPDPKNHYPGPVVVLIDEKTFGGAEDICIYLKNAGRATFVGGTTAGCNGNRTWLSLPGGGRLWFTGMRVKFGDGSRFQNIGIQPDVPVAPTVDGTRAGQDEVLEKGREVLAEQVRVLGVKGWPQRPLSDSARSPVSEDRQTKDEGPGDRALSHD